MAGINRLGKAPPKPGTLRPPDPNKYRTVDMFSEGAEQDVEYQRMVKDIEDMQQQQGWLFGRGAFDKADLLYLRDQAEQQRHKEIELRDNERTEYAQLKAQTEQEMEAKAAALSHKLPGAKTGRSSKLLPLIKVKSKGSDKAHDPGPPPKKAKTDKANDEPSSNAATTIGPSQDSACARADVGLLGLLGDYGSDDSDSEGLQQQVTVSEVQQSRIVLPSASELFGPDDQQQDDDPGTSTSPPEAKQDLDIPSNAEPAAQSKAETSESSEEEVDYDYD